MQVADLRTSYEKGALSEADVASDPIVQFDRWFKDAVAAGMPEPNCMTLATVGADGRPSTRIVLIKGYDLAATPAGASGRGFVWYTNFESRKGQEIAVHPHAALQFHWIGLERQVRIEGLVERATAAEADAYFASRPLGSRIGAWASPQSQLIPDREVLERREAEMKQRFGDIVPRPPHWGGYRLVPDYVEFWQGRPSRLHDRLVYRREDSHWTLGRLAP